ncbi:hypothetical protein AU15_09450 [Marinobacter salarius]|uniref:GAF domain-containing protein n=1 Tax=Marinobacter salarius TaxID=1420917 RepID=W5YVN3_9GAMM|nr:hypothetical protein AU15_09450 [Marinobacter salarius]
MRFEITSGTRDFPYVWTTGVLGISLLAGEFRDYWGRQQQKLEASNDYRGSRLEEFTRNYYLLKVSHDRLEQQLAGSSSSLREALRRLYAQIGEAGQAGLNQETASLMLQLLGRYGQLQIAGIYAVNNGVPEPEPLATVGRFRKVDLKDPLLLHALAERKLVSVQTEFRQRMGDLDTDLLAAIPLIDSEDRFIGLCVIEPCPFSASRLARCDCWRSWPGTWQTSPMNTRKYRPADHRNGVTSGAIWPAQAATRNSSTYPQRWWACRWPTAAMAS